MKPLVILNYWEKTREWGRSGIPVKFGARGAYESAKVEAHMCGVLVERELMWWSALLGKKGKEREKKGKKGKKRERMGKKGKGGDR